MAWVTHPEQWSSYLKKHITITYLFGSEECLGVIVSDRTKFNWHVTNSTKHPENVRGVADSLIEAKEKITSIIVLRKLTK